MNTYAEQRHVVQPDWIAYCDIGGDDVEGCATDIRNIVCHDGIASATALCECQVWAELLGI